MNSTPENLSGAIKRARELHREEIAERLRRRKEQEQARLEALNAVVRPSALASEPPVPPQAVPPPDRQSSVPVAEPEVDRGPADAGSAPEARAHSDPVAPRPPREIPGARVAGPQEPRPESLPSERFVKVRNSVFDELSRYLNGNQYKIYMELYRETLGRKTGSPTGYFRPREMAPELGIGSDQTVYRAFRELQAMGLISTEARVGVTKGTKVTVHALDEAMERLRKEPHRAKRGRSTTVKITTVNSTVVPITTVVQQKSLQYRSENHDGSVVKITTPHDHERHETGLKTPTTQASPAQGREGRDGGGEILRNQILEQLVTRYDYAPHLAGVAVDAIANDDLDLVPFLFARLDGLVERGREHRGTPVQNPAGLLSSWLADFDSWRSILAADRAQAAETHVVAPSEETTDLYLQYLAQMDTRAEDALAALPRHERARLEADVRRDIERRHPAARDWPPEHWERVVAAELKRSTTPGRVSYDEWLSERGNSV